MPIEDGVIRGRGPVPNMAKYWQGRRATWTVPPTLLVRVVLEFTGEAYSVSVEDFIGHDWCLRFNGGLGPCSFGAEADATAYLLKLWRTLCKEAGYGS